MHGIISLQEAKSYDKDISYHWKNLKTTDVWQWLRWAFQEKLLKGFIANLWTLFIFQ